MRKQKGFSLIELLIVVAIILIIAAIAIPNLMRARMSANEASAVGSVRSINTAEISYNAAYGNIGFSTVLTQLGNTAAGACTPSTTTGCFIDASLTATGIKSGYTFTLALNGTATVPLTNYSVLAVPTTPNSSGTRYFCSFEDAVIRSSATILANPCPPATLALQ